MVKTYLTLLSLFVCGGLPATALATGSAPVTWLATVGAQSNDEGRQALAFFPNEIWIHVGDSIQWTFAANELHTVTFIPDTEARPFFQTVKGSSTATFDNSTTVSSPGGFPDLGNQVPPAFVKGATFIVKFPTAGNFKQVCLFHKNMTGLVHVLPPEALLPYNQDFYDRQAAAQQTALLSDLDGSSAVGCDCAANNALVARVVAAGTGEISATAGGTQTLSVMRFLANQIHIRAGDTVEWTNQSPVEAHTVTFGTTPPPAEFFAPSADVTTDTDGALHGSVSPTTPNVSSGILAAGAQDPNGGAGNQTALGPTRFRVTFPKAGTFPYRCLLHDDLGMTGTVLVFP